MIARRSAGFTLIEVLVAMTILTMAFAVLFGISSRSLNGMRRAEDVERRIDFARNKLNELKLISDLQVGDRASGMFSDGTNWTMEVQPFVTPVTLGVNQNPDAIVRVRLAMEWPGRQETQNWSVDAYRLVRPANRTSPHLPLERQLNAIASK